jgi:hypothetical protein
MRKYLVRGGNTYPKARSCPNGTQHTDFKMSCLGTVVCPHPYINQDEVAWAFDTRVNRPLRYCYILAPESVLHIPVDYYLSVHNSGKIYLQHHHWYYIHTHDIPFFWIAVYLWWRYLQFLLSILKLFVLADI